MIANVFLETSATAHGKRAPRLGPEVLARLTAYDFPGNVRELKNTIEHAVILCTGDELRVEDLPRPLLDSSSRASVTKLKRRRQVTLDEAREKWLDPLERQYLTDLLAKHGGNVKVAARQPASTRSRCIGCSSGAACTSAASSSRAKAPGEPHGRVAMPRSRCLIPAVTTARPRARRITRRIELMRGLERLAERIPRIRGCRKPHRDLAEQRERGDRRAARRASDTQPRSTPARGRAPPPARWPRCDRAARAHRRARGSSRTDHPHSAECRRSPHAPCASPSRPRTASDRTG